MRRNERLATRIEQLDLFDVCPDADQSGPPTPEVLSVPSATVRLKEQHSTQVLPSSRAAAQQHGKKHFFNGRPCAHGHIAPRFTSSRGCVECAKVNSQRWHAANPEAARASYRKSAIKLRQKRYDYTREWRKRNPDHAAMQSRDWRARFPDRVVDYRERYYDENRDSILRKAAEKRAENADILAARIKAWKTRNADYVRAYDEKYRINNRPRKTAIQMKRHATKLQATPPWLTSRQLDEILTVYEEAACLTQATGVLHHVDHIVPLQGKLVCGLHVPWNLRAITQAENIRKHNKLIDDEFEAA